MDRNNFGRLHYNISIVSLSARRAWIEIAHSRRSRMRAFVALRKESVDRNLLAVGSLITVGGRSPQGERG